MVSTDSSGKLSIEPEADLLVAFVNSRDLEEGTDAIAAPEELAAWAAEHAGGTPPVLEPPAHERLLALRESLRALLRANNGVEAGAGDLGALREAAARSRYRLSLDGEGRLALDPDGEGAGALEARLLLAIERLQAQDAWTRLKACPADDCQWAFFDGSRNRSRTWCSMDECGNREKTRRYRRKVAS